MSNSFSRRSWLARYLGGGITATLAGIFYPVLRFAADLSRFPKPKRVADDRQFSFRGSVFPVP